MDTVPETFPESLGLWLGYLVGPAFGAGSLLRRARVFHPDGMLFHATVKPTARVKSRFYDLAKDLSGNAIMRFSSSIWKQESLLPDSLGCSLRFRVGKPPDIQPEEGVQDLIMITSPSLTALPLQILKTDQHDFLANPFYGAAAYRVAEQSDCRLRLMPQAIAAVGSNRNEKLLDAVVKGNAVLQLEVQEDKAGEWQPVVELRPDMPVLVDQSFLRFSPFRTGLGIQPQGLINYARIGPYAFSQFVRRKIARTPDGTEIWPGMSVPSEEQVLNIHDETAAR
jgi:hypothetical protein